MNQTRTAQELSNDFAREIEDIRTAAATADSQLRILRDLELGWVAGGDGQPVWL
ncbi:MAG TPA: hypothetical protein VEG27_13375 [Usitatibacter sp.]|nr:hypothetical protein [Usitatibacter sp.]